MPFFDFSAVDAEVGSHLFKNAICGLLKNKICVLITHQLHFLNQANEIIVLNNNGSITMRGTYKELTELNVNFSQILDSKNPITTSTIDGESRERRCSSTSSIGSTRYRKESIISEADKLLV